MYETGVRGGRCTRGAALKQIHDMGTRRYVLSVDNDNEFRSRCEWIICQALRVYNLCFDTKTVEKSIQNRESIYNHNFFFKNRLVIFFFFYCQTSMGCGASNGKQEVKWEKNTNFNDNCPSPSWSDNCPSQSLRESGLGLRRESVCMITRTLQHQAYPYWHCLDCVCVCVV